MVANILLLAAGAAILTPSRDGNDVQLPAEIAAHVPKNMRGYFLVFLVDPPVPKAMSDELFTSHQAYLRKEVEAGVIRLVGPITDGERLCGLKIINAASAEEALKIAEADPAVQEHVFAVEVHPVMLPSLSSFKIEYPTEK